MEYGNGQEKAAYQEKAMQDHLAAGKLLGSMGLAGQALNRPPAIRQRVQEANKRLTELSGKLSHLVTEIAPPVVLDGISKGDSCAPVRDMTLTDDVNELAREIGRIEQHVTRLAVAITG